jgi:hypothetical protein
MAEQVEEWRVIADYPDYEVSNVGNVRSNKNGKVRILKPSANNKGYKHVVLHLNGNAKTFKVHRLVAMTFIELVAGKLTVDHIDRVKNRRAIHANIAPILKKQTQNLEKRFLLKNDMKPIKRQ